MLPRDNLGQNLMLRRLRELSEKTIFLKVPTKSYKNFHLENLRHQGPTTLKIK